MHYFLLLVGLILILKSADILISASSNIAKRFGVSSFVIGITVVAFGTSAPELVVGIISGVTQSNQLAFGNVIGSFLSNIALIVGLAAIIMTLPVKKSVYQREIPMLFFVQILLLILILDGSLSKVDGIILILGFIAFILYIMIDAKKSSHNPAQYEIPSTSKEEAIVSEKQVSLSKSILLTIASLAGLIIGGKLTVDHSTSIAASLGLSETLIGLTVVAIATTMPELITSVVAALKKEPDIVLGNCIGSNIFNVLLVLGISSSIHPIAIDSSIYVDFFIAMGLLIFVFLLSVFGKRIKRPSGVILLAAYIGYLAYKVITVL